MLLETLCVACNCPSRKPQYEEELEICVENAYVEVLAAIRVRVCVCVCVCVCVWCFNLRMFSCATD
jgi:hypothetical protein